MLWWTRAGHELSIGAGEHLIVIQIVSSISVKVIVINIILGIINKKSSISFHLIFLHSCTFAHDYNGFLRCGIAIPAGVEIQKSLVADFPFN